MGRRAAPPSVGARVPRQQPDTHQTKVFTLERTSEGALLRHIEDPFGNRVGSSLGYGGAHLSQSVDPR
ncbi:MAG TPA: hypothetical protein VKP30_32335 [Polyangiaceae bacterium]|nr:hypothetical protein [Polyangiaceae bacterium]